MDKQLLQSFNNLSVALQNLADSLEKNTERTETSESMVADALQKLDIGEQLKLIQDGIKQLTETNTKIVEQQKSIIESMQKSGSVATTETGGETSTQKRMMELVERVSERQIEDSKKIQSTNEIVKRKQESTGPSYLPDKNQKKTITDGVKIILLIAGGILAIGLAFKLIGAVDFGSVIALAIALPLVAIAFKKIAEMKVDTKTLKTNIIGLLAFSLAMVAASYFFSKVSKISPAQAFSVLLIGVTFAALSFSINKLTRSIVGINLRGLILMPLVLISASLAIMASSYILGAVKPISLAQAMTTILIAAAFAALSYSIGELTSNLAGANLKGLILMPLVLVAASLAIMASSYILAKVQPVGIFQLLTSLAIAATFAVLSFGLAKIAKAASDINPVDLPLLPLVLIAASLAIMASSFLLSQVKLITFGQFLTSLGIAIVFIPISFALPFVAKAVKKVGLAEAALLPIVLVAMAFAITLSSKVLAEATVLPFSTLLNIAVQAITITIVAVALGFSIFVLSKLGLASPGGLVKVTFGGLVIVLIAATIAASSQVLSMGDYTNPPTLGWTLQSVLSILAFGILIAVTGTIIVATGGLGALAILAGALAVVAIAATILAVDQIIEQGSYTKVPSLDYAISTVLLLGTFGLVMVATSLLLPALALGRLSVTQIAKALVSVDETLSEGKYTKFPSVSYAASVSLLLASFAGAMLLTGLALPLILLGKKSVKLIAEGIRDSSLILNQGVYTGGPTPTWAMGVSLAIGAFSQVYKSLTSKGILGAIFGGEGSSPEKMKQAIITISEGIVTAAEFFANSSAAFVKGPPVSWSEGVGKAIAAFAPVYATLVDKGIVGFLFGGGGSSPEKMSKAIETISYGIITSAEIFSKNNASFDNPPPASWASGAGGAIEAFAPVFEYLNGGSWFQSSEEQLRMLISSILGVSVAIVESARIFDNGGVQYRNYPTEDWSKGISTALMAFSPIMKWASENNGLFSADAEDLKDTIVAMAESVMTTSNLLALGNYSNMIPDGYMQSLYTNIQEFMKITELLEGIEDKNTTFGLNIFAESGLVKMASDFDRLAESIDNVSAAISGIEIEKVTALRALTGSVVLLSLMNPDQFESMMDAIEEKSAIIGDVFAKMDESGISTLPAVRTAAPPPQQAQGMDQMLKMMALMDSRLSAIAAASSNVSSYVNQLRSSPSTTSMKK